MNTIDELLQGSIDMHIHHGPDAKVERRVDAYQAAKQAQEAGMKAIVLKSHEYPTAPLAYTVGKLVPDVRVFGSLALDLEVGGLNTRVLETSARLGAKVVWMPTNTATNHMKKNDLIGEGISIVDDHGKLLPVIGEILDIIKKYRMVLCTGHVSVKESFALVNEAKNMGLSKIVVTHPLNARFGAALTLDEQRQMVKNGAFIEHCFAITFPLSRLDPMTIVEAIRAVGAEHVVLSTDLGQGWNPGPAEGMRMCIAYMLKCGISEKEMELMVKANPATLLDLD